MATRTLLANIRTPRLRAITNRGNLGRFCGCSENAVLLCISMTRSLIALTLAFALSLLGVRVNTLTFAGVFNHQDPAFLDAYLKHEPNALAQLGRIGNARGTASLLAEP